MDWEHPGWQWQGMLGCQSLLSTLFEPVSLLFVLCMRLAGPPASGCFPASAFHLTGEVLEL